MLEKVLEDEGKKSDYVVRGAALKCSLGTSTDVLNLPVCHGVYLRGKAQCNITDSRSGKNILSFGACRRSTPPPACIPSIGCDWSNHYSTKLRIEGEEALIEDAHTFCAMGGVIKITNNGQ